MQRYSETVARIPFITKSPIFKEFFHTGKKETSFKDTDSIEVTVPKLGLVNDSPF